MDLCVWLYYNGKTEFNLTERECGGRNHALPEGRDFV